MTSDYEGDLGGRGQKESYSSATPPLKEKLHSLKLQDVRGGQVENNLAEHKYQV